MTAMRPTDEIQHILRQKGFTLFDPGILTEVHSKAIVVEYSQKMQEVYDRFCGQVTKAPLQITTCLINDLSLDAFIGKLSLPHSFLISLNYGIFANLYACFMGLLACPEILPHIGNSRNTHCMYTTVDYGLTDFTYHNRVVKKNTPVNLGFPLWNYPKDEDRILYALLLFDIAFEFIMYHEWGHLLGGHLSFLNQQYHADGISEINDRYQSTHTYMIDGEPIRKVMEFEADYIAASMICSLPYHLQTTHRSLFQAYPRDFLSRYDPRDAIFFSILSLFHLLEEVRRRKRRHNSNLYPSLYYRFCSLVYCLHNERESETRHLWKDYDYKGVIDFVKTTQTLKFNYSFAKYAYDERATGRHLLKLDDQLTKLRQHLALFRLI